MELRPEEAMEDLPAPPPAPSPPPAAPPPPPPKGSSRLPLAVGGLALAGLLVAALVIASLPTQVVPPPPPPLPPPPPPASDMDEGAWVVSLEARIAFIEGRMVYVVWGRDEFDLPRTFQGDLAFTDAFTGWMRFAYPSGFVGTPIEDGPFWLEYGPPGPYEPGALYTLDVTASLHANGAVLTAHDELVYVP